MRIVTVYLNGTTPDTLRSMMDKLRDKEPNAVGALIGTDGGKTTLAVGVGKNALARGLKAGALVKQIAAIAGGNGRAASRTLPWPVSAILPRSTMH